MNLWRKLASSIVIVVLICSMVPLLSSHVNADRSSASKVDSNELSMAPSTFDGPNRLLPVSILVYTEYADHNVELPNTMDAIDDTYGRDYYHENLTDYTQLDSMLPGHDILLIPEQEKTGGNFTDIGLAWASTLTSFVDDGGIVILMDYYGDSRPGPGVPIYNVSGLMEIRDLVHGFGWTNNLVNTSSALARGVDTTWTAASGSLKFTAPDATVIVDDGTDAVVAHKTMGKGHIVMLGFDMFDRESNYEMLLANSIRLHRHIAFDESHSPAHTIFGEFSNFTDDLVSEGFAVSSFSTLTPENLAACDVLVMTRSSTGYMAPFVDMIGHFVNDGGGLFIGTELSIYGLALDPVHEQFGFYRNKTGVLNDTDDAVVGGNDKQFALQKATNFQNHSATLSVGSIEVYGSTGFTQVPAGATKLIVTDSDGTVTFDGITPADGVPIAASATAGDGRIAVFADTTALLGQNDVNSDGTANYYEGDGEVLFVNCIRWLSASGQKEQIVLFDESHGPHFTLGISFAGLGNHLTSNGFTVQWMTVFRTTLLDRAHILVLVDGENNYTTAEIDSIEAFVATGGGLLLLGAYDGASYQVDAIGLRFGIDINNTGYLTDSDDAIVSDNYILYNESNLAVHPITQGISRLEFYFSTAFDTIGTATSLIATDDDGTCDWSNGGSADGLSIMVAEEHQLGRLVYSAEYIFLASNPGRDYDSDGQVILYDGDNDLLVTNIFQWLSEDRGPVVDMISPNGGEAITGDDVALVWDALDPNEDPILIDLFYSTNGGTDWTPITTGLEDDHYTWDVTGVPDSDEYLVRVVASSTVFTDQDESDAVFTIDHNPPDWIVGPSDQVINHTERIGVQFSATDISGVDSWWINDTVHFTINETGYLTDNMVLDVGEYGLDVFINDTLGHTRNYQIRIRVLYVEPTTTTTTPPTTTTTTTVPTTTTTPPPGGLDTTMIIVIIIGSVGVIIVLIILFRKKGS
ncbi:MAG: hypothetical protein ACW99U_05290 [Candidatus Thorarchaeota archaeon]|jgi:uncharacterized membrane protein